MYVCTHIHTYICVYVYTYVYLHCLTNDTARLFVLVYSFYCKQFWSTRTVKKVWCVPLKIGVQLELPKTLCIVNISQSVVD